MDRSQEEYAENPLTALELASIIRDVYINGIANMKNAVAKDTYLVEGAKVWSEFVRESFLGIDETEQTISWESYQKAKEITSQKKFIFCVKTFAEVDDNGNGLVDLQEAQNHVNWKKISHFMSKDKNLDGQISLAEFLGSVQNPFVDVLAEYKFRYNNYLQFKEFRK
ncbi:uncharacterized protein LOC142339830 [Convolutriloba macropyga]|uniref:uncharacterized protein LOC142339830 n=1 Tax=Convolutriloba macropyga TaxID=536237 RepID=UPI003F51EFCD